MSSFSQCHRSLNSEYVLEKEIGHGAFSRVYQARSRSNSETVAVKIVLFSKLSKREQEQQRNVVAQEIAVMREMQACCSDTTNLMKLQDVIIEPHREWHVFSPSRLNVPTPLLNKSVLFSACSHVLDMRMAPDSLILEILSGGELFDRIVERKRFSERDAALLTLKLLRALRALHEVGILHRDIKPENLVYATPDANAEIKITDFGLARFIDGGKTDVHRAIVGTPGYVAPEVLSSAQYGPPCDVWSLGVCVYILLSGYPPFYAEKQLDLFKVIKRGDFEFHVEEWKAISGDAKALISSMLTVDTARRITVSQALEHPWIRRFCDLALQSPSAAVRSATEAEVQTPHLTATLERMRLFNAKRKFKAAALAVVTGSRLRRRAREVWRSGSVETTSVAAETPPGVARKRSFTVHFTKEDLQEVRSACLKHGPDGLVSAIQLEHVLTDLGFALHLPWARMFELFDYNGDGLLDWKEIMAALCTLRAPGEDSLRFCFEIYDKDGNGWLSREELSSVLRTVMNCEAWDGELPIVAEKLREIFELLDEDGDGRVTFDEFRAGIEHEPLLVSAFLEGAQRHR